MVPWGIRPGCRDRVRRAVIMVAACLVLAPQAEASVEDPLTAHSCETAVGREEQVIDLARRRALSRGEAWSAEFGSVTAGGEAGDSPSGNRLQQLLGSDGNIERGAVVPLGDIAVLVDDGEGIFGTFLSGLEVDVVRVARQYYGALPDDIDHLTLLPNFDHDSGTFHLLIRNDVTGINRPVKDDAPIYGSDSRLQSVLLFSNYLRRPADPAKRISGDSNTFLSLMAHEFAHRFGAFVRFDRDPGPVTEASTRLLGRGQAHWCFYLNTASLFPMPPLFNSMSSLEGNLWVQDAQTGYWKNTGSTDGFSPLDLYLMGFIPPEQVPPMTLLTGRNGLDSAPLLPGGGVTGYGCVSQPLSVPHQISLTVDAAPYTVTMEDILAVEGPRVPDHIQSQKAFRQAMVLVSRQGRFPTPQQIARLETLRQAWEPYYQAATGGLSTVDTSLGGPAGPAEAFAFVRLPDDLQAERPLRLGLLALDAQGRVATGFTGDVNLSSPTDPAAVLPSGVAFTAGDRGYLLLEEPVMFASGGVHALTATATADETITGTRSGLVVEAPMDVDCMYQPGPGTLPSEKPWGVGATFSGVGGVRFQYLIDAAAINRPGVIRNLDWPVETSPDGVQWESLVVQMAHRSQFDLNTRLGETDLDRNFSESLDPTVVIFGPREQQGMNESGRVHMVLDPPFFYNGLDHLLIDVRYTGGGPPGLMVSEEFANGKVVTVERLGPNFPVKINRTPNVCVGMEKASGQLPSLSGLDVDEIRNDSVRVNWITSPATDGRVEYGIVGAPRDQVSVPQRFALSHSIVLENLETDTEYELVAVSRDYGNQEVRSDPIRVRTTRNEPQVFAVTPAALRHGDVSRQVLVSGEHFMDGFTAAIVMPDLDGPEPPPADPGMRVVYSQWLSETRLDLRVTVDRGAELGPRRLHVVNRDGLEVYSDVLLGIIPPTEGNDVDHSGRVDGFDLARLARAFGTTYPDPAYDSEVDLDGSGSIDGIDLSRLANNFGRTFLP